MVTVSVWGWVTIGVSFTQNFRYFSWIKGEILGNNILYQIFRKKELYLFYHKVEVQHKGLINRNSGTLIVNKFLHLNSALLSSNNVLMNFITWSQVNAVIILSSFFHNTHINTKFLTNEKGGKRKREKTKKIPYYLIEVYIKVNFCLKSINTHISTMIQICASQNYSPVKI